MTADPWPIISHHVTKIGNQPYWLSAAWRQSNGNGNENEERARKLLLLKLPSIYQSEKSGMVLSPRREMSNVIDVNHSGPNHQLQHETTPKKRGIEVNVNRPACTVDVKHLNGMLFSAPFDTRPSIVAVTAQVVTTSNVSNTPWLINKSWQAFLNEQTHTTSRG